MKRTKQLPKTYSDAWLKEFARAVASGKCIYTAPSRKAIDEHSRYLKPKEQANYLSAMALISD